MSNPQAAATVSGTEFIKAYRVMLLARVLEEKLASLYRGGMIKGGVFLGRGQEALSVSVGLHLRKGDIFAPLIRDQAGRMAFGDTVLDTLRTYLGSQFGSMRGRDGNIHRGRPREGYYAMISHLGAMIPAVSGALLARRMKGESGIVGATCLGDGGTSTGAFHEGLNAAAVEKLPLVLVVANNQYAYSTPNTRQFACHDLVDKAAGYGVAGHKVDATDLEQCLLTLKKAVRAARDGGGPFHSQSMEALYAHYPGLVVMTPATVEDAYSMLLEAVALDDPVIFCEHKFLYYHLKSERLPESVLPVGKARLARAGRDATIVTHGAMLHESIAAATELAGDGYEMEIVDLRTVKPLDMDTVLASVARTGRLLCVSEEWPWGGVAAEVIARVTSEGFGLLDVAPQRLNAKDTPVPYHPDLWSVHRPTASAIAEASRRLLNI